MMDSKLENEFNQAMIDIYHSAAEYGYRPTYFIQMINERGGLETAKALLAKTNFPSGLTRLWELNKLDISMEALVCMEQWSQLFTNQEITQAKSRLNELGYIIDKN